ncbi:MAG TPA: hypothetical protein VGG17_05410 [Acidimicrobiales bacterium]|jgi:hypothetical protein
MGEADDGTDRDPITEFLASPAHHYDEDVEPANQGGEAVSSAHMSVRQRFHHFMFQKKPSQYSSISPRKPDGSRTKIFFFNGNGRGR